MSSLTAIPRAAVRRLLDKALQPYFADLSDKLEATRVGVGPEADAPSGLTSDTFHMTLHELRTIELEGVRKGAETALSVGASGRWYFDWFETHYGPLERHIGVEAFEPMPEDLPRYAEWIDSSADRFAGVEDSSIDLVFAGQTTEHLWAEELVGFLLEAKRVLRTGGVLAVDSPNRLITEQIMWSHGGHTLELSPQEWSELVTLAGFSVERERGVWLCRLGDRVLELEDGMSEPTVLTRRIALGGDHVEGSFVWWIDARAEDGPADEEGLRRRVAELFDEHWNTRVSRGMWPGPGSEGPMFDSGHGGGRLLSSLPLMLHPGRWTMTVESEDGDLSDLEGLELRVTSPGDHVVHQVGRAAGQGGTAAFTFEQQTLQLALSLELHATSVSGPVRLAMPVSLQVELAPSRAERLRMADRDDGRTQVQN
jgi:SAM-dependent methyltransferase